MELDFGRTGSHAGWRTDERASDRPAEKAGEETSTATAASCKRGRVSILLDNAGLSSEISDIYLRIPSNGGSRSEDGQNIFDLRISNIQSWN